MIREKVFKDIAATIDEHMRFDSTDFKIESVKEQRSKNEYTTLTIRYSIESKYMIVFKVPNSETQDDNGYRTYYSFSGSVCPGPLAYEETFSFKGERGIFERITIWLNCIWEELSSNPVVKKVESQQQQIDEIFEKFEKLGNISDNYFTVEEANALQERLDSLEAIIKEQITQNQNDKELFEQEVIRLHTDIDTLKETILCLKKKGWLKSFTSKVFKWTKDSENRLLLKDGYAMIKEFLPEQFISGLN